MRNIFIPVILVGNDHRGRIWFVGFAGKARAASRPGVSFLRETNKPLIVSPLALAELDYLLRDRATARSGRSAVEGLLASNAIDIPAFTIADARLALDIDKKYAELDVGLADASLVVLAQRYRTTDLLTLDERHFRAIRPLQGGSFRIIPADL